MHTHLYLIIHSSSYNFKSFVVSLLGLWLELFGASAPLTQLESLPLVLVLE